MNGTERASNALGYAWLFGIATALHIVAISLYFFFFRRSPSTPSSSVSKQEEEIKKDVEEKKQEIQEKVDQEKQAASEDRDKAVAGVKDEQVERAKEIGEDVEKVNDFLKDVGKQIRDE